ncbi:GTP1/OBG subdomain-containing protein [Macrolepiota fuliginosa MF-IS2]|uniref:GTP1/OBG subdomain-containing protein n=1 Tax=Macrolepiota fuliginosa MF-IS2 TaxID=1400762 RepID=A0A9P6C3L1_9AGAR|nr:GTP1/OBG subdomain-containing protein [Macrolepiota fuliginosa MF-IS2]
MFSRRAFCSSVRRQIQRSPEEVEAYKRKRQAEWKRKQGGNAFLDHLIVTVRGGKGGDGCAAFHREKFKPFGPPSGGNGGKGGPVYFLPTPSLSTLSTVQSRIRGHNGEHGKGTWQNGKAGEPLVIKVPLGTVVKELGRHDPRRAKDEWETEEETMEAAGLPTAKRVEQMRERRWVHYPGHGETNVQRDDFKEAETAMYKLERERRLARRRRLDNNPIFLDLDKDENPNLSSTDADNAPLGIRQPELLGHLIAQGGLGGLGNPHFVSTSNRTPRYGSRGHEGERVTLFLELKLLADIGLVGMPNAGKSTLLRALTGGRAKTDVAGYAFTTLNPVVGIVRVAEDGTFEGELVPDETVYDETKIEDQAFKEKMERGEFADSLTRNQLQDPTPEKSLPPIDAHSESTPTRPGHHFDLYESFRFTIADNPGLIENSASPMAHAGLGHSFLRAIERSPALVCVVDFSASKQPPEDSGLSTELQPIDPTAIDTDPCEAIKILKNELETYQEGMSSRIKMVIANKADLVAAEPLSSSSPSEPSVESIEEAQARLKRLEEYVKTELGDDVVVVPVSAKYRMNLRKVIALMRDYVEDARAEKLMAQQEAEEAHDW